MSIIAHWSDFTNDEETAGEVHDISVNSNTGTLYDDAEFVLLGARGRVINFTGTDASVRVPDSPSVSPTAAISIGAWIYKTDTLRAMIVDKDGCYRLWIPLDDNVVCFNVYAGGAWREFQSTVTIPINQWVFVQAGYDDATDTVQVYCQGSLNGENTSWNHGAINDNDYQLHFGKYASGGYLFKGYIAEVIIRDELVALATHRTDLKRWLKRRSGEVIEFLELHIGGGADPILITTQSTSIIATVYDVLGVAATTTTSSSSTTTTTSTSSTTTV